MAVFFDLLKLTTEFNSVQLQQLFLSSVQLGMENRKIAKEVYVDYKSIGELKVYLRSIGFTETPKQKFKGHYKILFFRGKDAVEFTYRFFVCPSLIIMYCNDGKNWNRVDWQDIPEKI